LGVLLGFWGFIGFLGLYWVFGKWINVFAVLLYCMLYVKWIKSFEEEEEYSPSNNIQAVTDLAGIGDVLGKRLESKADNAQYQCPALQ
jgi:hypothetical protein